MTEGEAPRRGRPRKYANDEERRAARAVEARVRRSTSKQVAVKKRKDPRGRPAKYNSDQERKAARALAARERRAKLKKQGYKEIRRLVQSKDTPLKSEIIDLSALSYNLRPK